MTRRKTKGEPRIGSPFVFLRVISAYLRVLRGSIWFKETSPASDGCPVYPDDEQWLQRKPQPEERDVQSRGPALDRIGQHLDVRGEHSDEQQNKPNTGGTTEAIEQQAEPSEYLEDAAQVDCLDRQRNPWRHDPQIAPGHDEMHRPGENEKPGQQVKVSAGVHRPIILA